MNLHRVVLRCSLLSVSLLAFHPEFACAQVQPRVTQAVDGTKRITLRGNVHPLARAEFDRGAVADSQPMNRILLQLKRSDEQETALQTMLQNQQDKSSPNYHQWLTPEQFGAQYGPEDADIQAVTNWLTSQGFTINKIYSGKNVIEFSGTAVQVQQAFGTAIHYYEINGKTYTANTSDPQIPAALAPVVTGVVSLHNFPRQFYAWRVGNLHRSAGKSVLEPLTTIPSPSGSGNFYGVGPADFAKIYNIPATCGNPAAACTGSGQSIAIVGETDINVTDVQQFRAVFGLPANYTASNIIYNGEDPGITGTDEEGEADLDNQWSGGVAPGATVTYVVSASTSASQGVDLSALYIVEYNVAAVMSESYGACEASLGIAENSFVNNLWEQASAQGITVAISSGDSGSAGCDDPHTEGMATEGLAVNGLGSTPYNVAVGGTDFDEYNKWTTYWNITNNPTTQESVIGYIPEIPWNQSCAQLGATGCNINTTPPLLQNIVAGGGGASSQYNKPSWQMGVSGMPNDNHRDVPDVSLFASPGFNGSGYLYCQVDVADGQTCGEVYQVVGGTSVSSPSFAGIMALVNQSQATAQNPAPRQGNANYVLYELSNKSGAYGANCASSVTEGAGCVFNDITRGSSALPSGGAATVGTNSVPCKLNTLDCSGTTSAGVGVLVTEADSSTLAWTAGTGYDLATGLGSLNVSNLIKDWGTVATVPTTTTLSLNPATGITHGSESVTATISVTPSSGTASGTVSLIATPTAGSQFGAGQFTLGSNDSVTGNVVNLPGGNGYQVYAHYSGDGTNAPSNSAPVSVTVAQQASKTFIVVPTFDSNGNETSGNASSVAYGSSYIVRMYVTNSAGTANPNGAPTGACTQTSSVTCPSGTVSLTANGAAVDGGTFNLNNIGYTRDIAPTLAGGTTTIAAAYSGDSSYTASQTSEPFTVTPAATTLTAPTIPGGVTEISVGGQAPFMATVETQAFTGVAPTGTVTFYDGSTPLTGQVTLSPVAPSNSNSAVLYAQIEVPLTTTGSHTISAKYSGDGNYAAATSPSTTIGVVYPTTISISASSPTIYAGQSVTLTAVLSSQGKSPVITGQIQFYGPTPFTNVTNTPGTDSNGNQNLTATATIMPTVSAYYQASYAGDTNYESANAEPGVYLTINIPDFSLGPAAGLSVVPTAGQAGSGQITITPATQVASTVTLQLVSPPTIAGYTLSLSPQQVNLSGSAVQAMLNLTPSSGTSGAMIRGQVRKAAFLPFTRHPWWALSLASAVALIFVLGGPGRRRRMRAALGLSLICVLCFILGCGGGGGSGGGGGGGGGGQTATSIALATSDTKVTQSGMYTITATITGSSTNITGTVNFYDYGSLIVGPVNVVNGEAQMGNTNLNAIGVHQITAKYSGDANNLPSTSGAVTQTITGTVGVSIQGSTGSDTHAIAATIGIQ